uniref:Uncharacterized protein n=1 Tax=Arundo donax TaxID=35708 RepID=A0A0A9GIJ1_ARUDO
MVGVLLSTEGYLISTSVFACFMSVAHMYLFTLATDRNHVNVSDTFML